MDDPTAARAILIATGNPGKFREITALLSEDSAQPGHPRVCWRSLKDLGGDVAEPVEDGPTFAANAAIKARHYSRWSGLWTLADDSGLEVDALGGAPGVRSARYVGLPAGTPRGEADQANNRRLISELAGIPPERRSARFRCALVLADADRILATAEGIIEGGIIDEPRGSNGFGYDPHFLVPDLGMTTAELAALEKNRISHRGQALRSLREQLTALLAGDA